MLDIIEHVRSQDGERARQSPRFKPTRGNVPDPEYLTQAVRDVQPEFVFHLAANAKVRALGWQPKLSIREGILCTLDCFQNNLWVLDSCS